MTEYLGKSSRPDEIRDEFPSGALFEINTDIKEGETPRELVIVPLGASAVRDRFPDVRMAAANDALTEEHEE